jgi:hypothetical protein
MPAGGLRGGEVHGHGAAVFGSTWVKCSADWPSARSQAPGVTLRAGGQQRVKPVDVQRDVLLAPDSCCGGQVSLPSGVEGLLVDVVADGFMVYCGDRAAPPCPGRVPTSGITASICSPSTASIGSLQLGCRAARLTTEMTAQGRSRLS